MSNINVEFTFEELAGLYYLLNLGFISIILQNTPEDEPQHREAALDHREILLELRKAGNYDDVVNKANQIREMLSAEAAKLSEAPSE